MSKEGQERLAGTRSHKVIIHPTHDKALHGPRTGATAVNTWLYKPSVESGFHKSSDGIHWRIWIRHMIWCRHLEYLFGEGKTGKQTALAASGQWAWSGHFAVWIPKWTKPVFISPAFAKWSSEPTVLVCPFWESFSRKRKTQKMAFNLVVLMTNFQRS